MSIRQLSFLLIGGVILSVLLYAGLIIYLTWPISVYSISVSGVFGDSFGLLTSLFSGLAFAGLIITIIMQKEELALQRTSLLLTHEEIKGQKLEMMEQNATLRVQRFENTFFNMLELLDSCRNDISYNVFQGGTFVGRDAIRKIYLNFCNSLLRSSSDAAGRSVRVFDDECLELDGIREKYNRFYDLEYGEDIGQYYLTLYNILKLVDTSDYLDNKNLYTNLVRAQLSRYELSMLFYNCISDFGKEKMAPLVRNYRILKHLEENTLPPENIEIWRGFNELPSHPSGSVQSDIIEAEHQ